MAWWKFWETKQKNKPLVVENKFTHAKEPFINVKDYPKSKYSVYWETVISFSNEGLQGEVRFLERNGKVVESHQVFAPSVVQIEELAAKLIREKMQNFKVS